jgi:hypothetical protein
MTSTSANLSSYQAIGSFEVGPHQWSDFQPACCMFPGPSLTRSTLALPSWVARKSTVEQHYASRTRPSEGARGLQDRTRAARSKPSSNPRLGLVTCRISTVTRLVSTHYSKLVSSLLERQWSFKFLCSSACQSYNKSRAGSGQRNCLLARSVSQKLPQGRDKGRFPIITHCT